MVRENFRQRPFKRMVQQPRAALGVHMQVLDQDRSIIDQTNTANQENGSPDRDLQMLVIPRGGEDPFLGNNSGAGESPLSFHVLGEAYVSSGIVSNAGRRNKPTATLEAVNKPFHLELNERLTGRYPRDLKNLANVPFRGQFRLWRKHPRPDQGGEMVTNAQIIRNFPIP